MNLDMNTLIASVSISINLVFNEKTLLITICKEAENYTIR